MPMPASTTVRLVKKKNITDQFGVHQFRLDDDIKKIDKNNDDNDHDDDDDAQDEDTRGSFASHGTSTPERGGKPRSASLSSSASE